MAEVFCNVYKETDYSKFKYLIGNRNLAETRKKRIMDSIQTVGYVLNPIIVNEKMEIIDGQGRHAACKELGLPIYYVIAEGASTDECVNLNIGQTNWGTLDFINFYAEQGKADYQQLLRLIKEYPSVGVDAAIAISLGHVTTAGSKKAIKNGGFSFRADIKDIEAVLHTLAINRHTVDMLRGSKRAIYAWIGWAMLNLDIDASRLFSQIAKNLDSFPPVSEKNAEYFLDILERVYNKNLRIDNCRYFVQPFKVYRKKTKAQNCANGLHAKKWREQQMLEEGA